MNWTICNFKRSEKISDELNQLIDKDEQLEMTSYYLGNDENIFRTNSEVLSDIPKECVEELEEKGETEYMTIIYKVINIKR